MSSSDDIDYLNEQYNARAAVLPYDKDEVYRQRSAAALKKVERIANIVYDRISGSRLDIYPAQSGAPLFVWIHGGYWRSSTKDENIFVAPGLVKQGIAVANIDYQLAPHVNLDEIVRQVRSSIAWLAKNSDRYGIDARRIHVGGHSAGGHLVGMLLADDWQSKFDVKADIIGIALAVSGLFDLDPLKKTFVNEPLSLDERSIKVNSPINLIPRLSDATLLATVGGDESIEFQKQTDQYLKRWTNAGHKGRRIHMPGTHHFSIILELESGGNPLFDTLVDEIKT